MKKLFSTSLLLGAMLGGTQPALAHVIYSDLNVVPNSSGSFRNNAWYLGTRPELGDSHDVEFFKFVLNGPSLVSITFRKADPRPAMAGTDLKPAFSLYRGLLPEESYDDTAVDPLNPAHLEPNPTPHWVKDPSPIDDGQIHLGVLSPFRDTEHIEFAGQFDALHTWSMANDSGQWGLVEYLTHAVAADQANTVSLLNYSLPAGAYTVVAAGANPITSGPASILGTLQFSATAVPVPGAAWLFGSAVAGLGAAGWRRRCG